MGNILPASITHPQVTGPNALPNRTLFNNGNVNYSAAIGDIGDILRGLGGPAGSWDPILRQREAEDAAQQQRAIEAQRYAAATRQQQFSNNLALQNFRLRAAALLNRGQTAPNSPAGVLGTGRPNTIIDSIQPLTSAADSGVPIPTPKPNNLGDPAASNLGPTISSLAQLQGASGPRISALQTKNAPSPSTVDANAAMNPVGTAAAAPIARQNVNLAGNGINNLETPQRGDVQITANSPRIGDPNNISVHGVISPDALQGTAREIYDKLNLHLPELAKDLIRAANHQTPLNDILKNWKSPADRVAISQALNAINPNYDERIAQSVQQFQKNLNNPRLPANMGLRSDQELANLIQEQEENAKNLPDWRYQFLTGIRDRIGRWTGNQALSRFDQKADEINKEIERERLQGRPTVSSLSTLAPLYNASLGRASLRRSYEDLLRGVDRRNYDRIYNAVASTSGYGGYRVENLDPAVVARLRAQKYIRVDDDGKIIPLRNLNN